MASTSFDEANLYQVAWYVNLIVPKKILKAVEGKHHDAKPRYSRKRKPDTIADLEAAMGKKADAIGDYTYDPETGSWGRTITFNL